jgi:hypothetical protein
VYFVGILTPSSKAALDREKGHTLLQKYLQKQYWQEILSLFQLMIYTLVLISLFKVVTTRRK